MDPIVGILQKKARIASGPMLASNFTVPELEQWLDLYVMPYRGMVTVHRTEAGKAARLYAIFKQGRAPFKLTDALIVQYRNAIDLSLRSCAPAFLYALWME